MITAQKYIDLLSQLISTPSLSREEDNTALVLESFLKSHEVSFKRKKNNFICTPNHFDKSKKNIVLNSHHDTVKPKEDWTKDPFTPTIIGGKLYGLGSNDAGGCLVSLIATFIHYKDNEDLDYNLFLIISAEEEISGANGLRLVLPTFKHNIDLAIVGEPTQMNMAIAEKGLLVIDGEAEGKSGHAANQYGDNAITAALKDIEWIQSFEFEKKSPTLGPVKLTVTQINAGTQHNVVPDSCKFVIDCRVNEHYTNKEVLAKLQEHCASKLTARSTHLQSSSIPMIHPIVRKGIGMGWSTYGSPTMSDQVFFLCPSIKIGPGKSERSHTADEFIYIKEIEEGIKKYISLLDNLKIA